MQIDRVEEWKKFAEHMEGYIKEQTLAKYGMENSGNGVDLMAITHDPKICVWNILRYSLRMWNGKMKEHDLEKVAHYAELAWTLSGEKPLATAPSETK